MQHLPAADRDARAPAALIRIWGLRRSGLHALATWLGHQLPQPAWLFNDVAARQPPAVDPYLGHRVSPSYAAYLATAPCFRLPTPAPADRAAAKAAIVVIYEDVDVAPVPLAEFFGPTAPTWDLLLLRDPFNLMASRMHRGPGDLIAPSAALALWAAQAQRLLAPDAHSGGAIGIRYNQWFTSPAYRRQLARRLGLRFDDRGMDEVSGAGGGSSFDGRSKQGRAREMRTLDRWQLMLDNPQYRALFTGRTDLAELSDALFGPIAGSRVLTESAS